MFKRMYSEFQISKTEINSEGGMIVSGHKLSAEAGARILEEGGNAFDAAAAAIFATWVVEPENCGLGGVGRGVVYNSNIDETKVLSFTGRVPAAASSNMFELQESLDPWGRWRKVKNDANMVGPKSHMVPGMLAGVCAVIDNYGTMSLGRLLEPAIDLARNGFDVDGYTALHIGNNLSRIREYPLTSEIFAPDGVPPKPGSSHQKGSTLFQKDLANTMERIAEEGPEVFYGGEIGKRIEKYLSSIGGILTADDLFIYSPEFNHPTRIGSYRGYKLIWADGYFVNLILNILENFDLRSIGPDHPIYYHLMIESMRYAFAAILEYLGDPIVRPSPVEGLWSKSYAEEIANCINTKEASAKVNIPDPWPHETRITGQRPPNTRKTAGGCIDLGTSQVITADKEGNLATFNITHSGPFGSFVTIPQTGILLNGAMVSMDPEPGKSNSIHPDRRAMSFSAPVLVLKDDKPKLVFSGSGGRTIISSQVFVLSGVLDFGKSPQEAIETPRLHCETGKVFIDQRINDEVLQKLILMGHSIKVIDETFHTPYFGRPVSIEVLTKDQKYRSGISHLHRTAAIGLSKSK